MATRPWLTPEELKEYTDFEKVKNRDDIKVKTDITRAENYIIHRTNNDFSNEIYITVPDAIKLATLLVAEYYSQSSAVDKDSDTLYSDYQSESFKDYSYTKKSSVRDRSVEDIDIDALISRYIKQPITDSVRIGLRKL